MVLPVKADGLKNQEFRKCGEITAATKVGKNVYGFNCSFCVAANCLPFLSFENFVLHIEEYHRLEFAVHLGLDQDEDLVMEDGDEIFPTISKDSLLVAKQTESIKQPKWMTSEVTQLAETEIKFSDMIKENKVAALHMSDPLDVPPLQSVPNTFEVKIEEELIINDCDDDDLIDNYDQNNDQDNTDSNMEDVSDSDMDTSDYAKDAGADSTERRITLAIIECYKKHRLLWDPKYMNGRCHRKRKVAFGKIADTVNKQIGAALNLHSVRERINNMRHKFRSHRLATSRNKQCTPLWYYDKLEFLHTTIKCKQRFIIGAKALANEAPALPLPDLSDEQNLVLIEIYKSFPCLWDVQHIGYRFQNQRQDALDEMLQTIKQKINFDFTHDDLQKRINSIRYACTQEKYRKLHCERVKEEFTPNCKYYENICFLEQQVGPFQCPFCDEMFNGCDKYKIHKNSHDGSMPFTCPLCDHGFMESGNYKVHVRRHTRDYEFECEICHKRYATATDVTVHMRVHTGEKPYFCDICGESFRTQSFFLKHMRRHQNQPSYKCTICMKAFYENHVFKEHMNGHLNIRDKVCNICGKGYTTKKYLRRHKKIHELVKSYVCKICGKEFAQDSGLSSHKKTHRSVINSSVAEEKQ